MTTLLFIAVLVFAGCDASFTDLRPDEAALGQNNANNANNVDNLNNGNNANNVNNVNNGNNANNLNNQNATDMGTSDEGNNDPAGVIALGAFIPGDYGGEGNASLVEVSIGQWEVQLSDDFLVGSVPGPTVVLTREATLGSTIDPARGDLELGVLESLNGASSYPLSEPPDGRRNVWIYCKPFGLEMTRAPLVDQ